MERLLPPKPRDAAIYFLCSVCMAETAFPSTSPFAIKRNTMLSIRDFIDPGGKMLAHRLDQLCMTLEGLGTRLRGSIANAIGETIGGIVRDTALRVLDEATRRLSGNEAFSPTWSRTAPNTLAGEYFEPEERDFWTGDPEDRYESDLEDSPTPMPQQRLPTALSAGLQAASWWLRRWSGQGQTLTTLAVGLFATGLAFLGGPLVIAMLGLAESATRFHSLSEALGTRQSNFSSFYSA